MKAMVLVRESVDEEDPDRVVMVLLRGDHELNTVKTQKIIGPFRFANESEITEALRCRGGYIGPVNVPASIAVYADRAAAQMSNFACGANEAGHHYVGANWGRDVKEDPAQVHDFRNVVEGDASPDGTGPLALCRGIEVGHVFQLGAKYSEAMGARFLDEGGKSQVMEMGCYGIGVSRIVAAAIEQNNDERGILWPMAIAPFQAAVLPIGAKKSPAVRDEAERIYGLLRQAGVEVLLDDRDERPGAMFADAELIGLPQRIVVGDRGLKDGRVEYQARSAAAPEMLTPEEAVQRVINSLCPPAQ